MVIVTILAAIPFVLCVCFAITDLLMAWMTRDEDNPSHKGEP